MCVFCAAIPVAAATGFKLNANQIQARHQAEAHIDEPAIPDEPKTSEGDKPILRITGGVIVLLLIGSVTYHTLTYQP